MRLRGFCESFEWRPRAGWEDAITIQPSPASRIVAVATFALGSSSAAALAPLLLILILASTKLELGIRLNVVELMVGFCLFAGFYFLCSLPLSLLAGVLFVALDRRVRRRYLLALFTIALVGALAWQGNADARVRRRAAGTDSLPPDPGVAVGLKPSFDLPTGRIFCAALGGLD